MILNRKSSYYLLQNVRRIVDIYAIEHGFSPVKIMQ